MLTDEEIETRAGFALVAASELVNAACEDPSTLMSHDAMVFAAAAEMMRMLIDLHGTLEERTASIGLIARVSDMAREVVNHHHLVKSNRLPLPDLS